MDTQTTSSATTTTAPATPAAAPSAPSTVNDAAAALAFADSSLATPETSADPTPAAAVTPPAETPATASTETQDDPRSPFIPRERFDTVNTRMQKAEEALKQYEWAKDLQPDEVQGLSTWARALKTSPVEAALHLLSQLEADPNHSQALRSHFARTLGAARKPAQPAAEPMPEPDLQTGDGTPVYSAPQLQKWQEWNAKQLTTQMREQFTQEFKPLADTAQELKTRKEQEQQQAQTVKWANSVLAPLKRLPYYDDFKADIGKALADPANASKNPEDVVYDTYASLHKAKLDTLGKSSEAQVLASLQQRAVAGTNNPATATTATPKSTIGDARAALEHAYAVTGS